MCTMQHRSMHGCGCKCLNEINVVNTNFNRSPCTSLRGYATSQDRTCIHIYIYMGYNIVIVQQLL